MVKYNRIRFRHRHPYLARLFMAVLLIGVFGIFAVFHYVQGVLEEVPTVTEGMLKSEPTSNMYDNKGRLIWSETKVRRDYIKKEDIPELYKDLLLSTEDRTFYTDGGFSYSGLANAGLSLVKEKLGQGESRGGSSIEQQLIKYVVFSTDVKDRTIDRKVKELWLAQQLYENYSKDDILEFYVNKIDMGEGSHGANTIANTYYGKSLNEMSEYTPENIAKQAVIAGLGQAPTYYNIYDNPERTKMRRDTVLYSAYMNGKLTKLQYERALDVDIQSGLKPRHWRNKEVLKQTQEHSAYVNSVLAQVKELGYDISKTPMQIYTELDTDKNAWLNQTVDSYPKFKDVGQQFASTVMDNNTGVVIAQYGGRHVNEPYALNRATQHTRSSGSTIKPFIDYGTAIEYLGYGTNYRLDSSPYRYAGTNIYAYNYGKQSYGIVDMKKALRWSLNTPALRLLDNHVGSDRAKEFLSKLDMDVKETYGGSDALGLDVSTADLSASYGAIANGGNYQKPRYINKIVFSDGSSKTIRFPKKRAMRESTAFILTRILQGTTLRYGSSEKSRIPEFKGHIVKTGTVAYDSNSDIWRPDTAASDALVAGSTKDIAIAVWTGYDSPNKSGHWVLEGQDVRHDLYKQIMRHYNKGRDTSNWSKPSTVGATGNGLNDDYYPLDASSSQFDIPNIDVRYGSISEQLSRYSDIKVEDSKEQAYVIPKSYQRESWNKNLKGKNKTIYERFMDGERLPEPREIEPNVYTD